MLAPSTTMHYRYFKIDRSICEPTKPALNNYFLKCIKACVVCRAQIERAEKLLFAYKTECCKIVPFFYAVALCSRALTDERSELKGLAIDFQKEDFNPEKLKSLWKDIKNVEKGFKKQAMFAIGSYIAIGATVFIGILATIIATVIKNTTAILAGVSIICVTSVILVVTIAVSNFIGLVEHAIVQRLATIIGEDIGNHFSHIYEKVQFVRQEGEQFLYDIDKGLVDEEYKSFYFAENFYKKNEKKAFPLQTV